MKSGIAEKIKLFIQKSHKMQNIKSVLRGQPFLGTVFSGYWPLIFFILIIIYLELIYRLAIFHDVTFDFLFPVLFALSVGGLLYLIIGALPKRAAAAVSGIVTFAFSLVYAVQLVYHLIFHTPLSLYSIGGAGDAMQFSDVVSEVVLKNIFTLLLIFAPAAVPIFLGKELREVLKRKKSFESLLLFMVFSFTVAVLAVNLTDDTPASQHSLYYEELSPELSMNKLGVLTTMRLDLQRLISSDLRERLTATADTAEPGTALTETPQQDATQQDATQQAEGTSVAAETSGDSPPGNGGAGNNAAAAPQKVFNIMDIDFEKLIAASGDDASLLALNKYFSNVQPTKTNQYTGMFKDCNLILITAEGFSPMAISPELTPTLYKMSTQGFVFKNFYNPVWWVSTSDGEYAGDIGLIPKSGVWSMAASGKNYLPFAMGNQFRRLGYITKAYHDHTYTYYKRDISHPNMGYEYKGVGNGLIVKKTWPESDLEMIDVTAPDFIGNEPFHVYYMTVSGHMNYSFNGNYMSSKNRKYVENLPYSDESKAYIACNLELEFAMKALIEKLEVAGIADNTVIALSSDHYPYGLQKESIDELAGHTVEENFELYKSVLILWKQGMQSVSIDKPCASMDRIPTLSNLFGLEYDSRLLMGTDILSDSPALVVFSNRSWITDRARFNTVTNKAEFFDGTTEDREYVNAINRIVAQKFKYSQMVLDKDYYRKILPH